MTERQQPLFHILQPEAAAAFGRLSPPYGTIVADPPWRYRDLGRGLQGLAENNYSTMTNSHLCELPVADLAAADAHCYLWTTNPKLEPDSEGVSPWTILAAWGFRYVTLLTWKKSGMGMGFYFRGDTEHILFGVRGKAPIPPTLRERNWFEAPKLGHSVKPPAFFDKVERVSPGPYVELFCRQPRFGWDHWGKGYESSKAEPSDQPCQDQVEGFPLAAGD